jgi:inner membrane protein
VRTKDTITGPPPTFFPKPHNPEVMEVPVPKRNPFWHSLSFKLMVVGILILAMLIPGALIRDLIREREQTQADVVAEIGSKWGGSQTLNGPVLSIPYYKTIETDEKTYREIRYAHFLPEELNISARVEPEIRYRGIYKTVVYRSRLLVDGSFLSPDPCVLKLEDGDVLFRDAFLQVGVSDMRGIRDSLRLQWNGETLGVESGIPARDIDASGFHARVPLGQGDKYDFRFEMVLNGSSSLFFTPVGRVTGVRMESSWGHPKFDGAFLPDEREVSPSGFTAGWKVLHLNRNFPQAWKDSEYRTGEAAFGVDLILPVDQYRKTMRSAKYAIMFIALTFMIFFFTEVLNRKRIHPIQYLLVGLSISIFYVLLLSLAEQIGFNLAYLVSAAAVVGLISGYSVSVFRNTRLTLVLAFCLVVLYAFLYCLIQRQDYALLMGSVGLFAAMALIMYASRNVDWYGAASGRDREKPIGF